MKKYDLKSIMSNAWEIRSTAGVSMSIALKAAWATEKAMMEAEKIGKESGWNHRVVANDWAKGGHNRTYVSARIYTNAWNPKREYAIGYTNNLTGAFVRA